MPVILALLGAILALILFGVQEWAKSFFFAPLQEQKKIIGEINFALVVHKDLSDVDRRRLNGNPVPSPEEIKEIENTLRSLAGRLQSTLWTIPKYEWCARRGWVIRKENIDIAAESLDKWSHSIRTLRNGKPGEFQLRIANSLGIKYQLLLLNNRPHTTAARVSNCWRFMSVTKRNSFSLRLSLVYKDI